MFDALVSELLVNFVGENQNAFLFRNCRQGGQLFAGVHRAGWVPGRVDDHHLGSRGHGLFKLGGGHFPAAFFRGLNKHRFATGNAHHFRIT